jgi:hypothetical protein
VIGSALDYITQLAQQFEYLLATYSGNSRVPKLNDDDTNGSAAYACQGNKLSGMANGTLTNDAATVGQITGILSGIVVGGPGVLTEIPTAPPAASVTYKNTIIVVRYAGGPSVAMICLEQAAGVYDWQVI